jgi:hypothetical protein
MIGRQDNHRRAIIARGHPSRGQGDRRSCIALRRFGDDVFLRESRYDFTHGGFLVDVR